MPAATGGTDCVKALRPGLWLLGAFGAAIGSAAALWWFVRADRLGSVSWSLAVALAAAVALLLHVAAHATNGFRMSLLSGGVLSWSRGWAVVTVGVFGAATTPARVGGEALKALDLRRWLPWPGLVSLLLAERLFDIVVLAVAGALVVVALVGVAGSEQAIGALVAAILVLLVLAGALAALAWRERKREPGRSGSGRILGFMSTLREGLRGLAELPQRVRLTATLLTVLVWGLEISGFLAAAWVLSLPLTPLDGAILVLGVTLVQSLPLLPSGAGTVDAYAALVAPALGAEVGGAYLVWRASVLSYDLVVGGVAAFLRLLGHRMGLAQQSGHGVEDQASNQ